ncbi:MAG: PP2C family protein-serine/threonine phosphatase [Proteobacteria bacterium]|nr:PP2C family protein-serine/threonine phosphatase [Pseudomonadota bacterium]
MSKNDLPSPPSHSDPFPYKRAWLAATIAFLLSLLLTLQPAKDYIESNLSLPLIYRALDACDLSSSLSKQLKIIVYDDPTFARTGDPTLSLTEWSKFIKLIAARSPQAIYIDKVFYLPLDIPAQEIDAFNALGGLSTKIVTIAFTKTTPIPGRSPLDLSDQRYRDPDPVTSGPATAGPTAAAGGPDKVYAYGRDERLAKTLHRIGHAMNGGSGRIAALSNIGPDTVLPHVALMASDTFQVLQGRLVIDGTMDISRDHLGRVVVEFLPRRAYQKSSISMGYFLSESTAAAAAALIEPGDHVLVAPQFYTGNTDFSQTPVGSMPGAYVIASLINSVINRNFITPSDGMTPIICFALYLLTGLIWGQFKRRRLGTIAILLLIWPAACVVVFAYQRTLLDVFTPVATVTLCSLAFGYYFTGLREGLLAFINVLSRENVHLRGEIAQASDIANALHEGTPPEWGGYEVVALNRALSSTSGDWIHFEAGQHSGLKHAIMCDIAGHGLQASILVSTCKSVLQAMMLLDDGGRDEVNFIKRYASLLNEVLYRNGKGDHAASLLGVTLHPDATITVVCCGHPAPIMVRPGDPGCVFFEKLSAPNSTLGNQAAIPISSTKFPFAPEDLLILHSDGIVLPRSGLKLTRYFNATDDRSPFGLAHALAADFTAAHNGLEQDDLSIICIKKATT